MSSATAKTAAKPVAIEYNRAKIWQIALFVMNNTATNTAMLLLGYYAFYTQNVLGLAAVVVGLIATLMRVWDGITDPIIGYLLDKTNGRFGKFRPFMFIGNIIIITTMVAIFHIPGEWATLTKYIATTILYVVHIIGYTFQTACTKGAQAALTNDPKQRPIFTWFDAIFNLILFNGATFLITKVMAPTYAQNMIDPQLFKDISYIFAALSFALTILAIIGIWKKDRTEYFGLGESTVKVKFSDYLEVIKNNRPLQMLIVAASTDKLANVAVRGGLIYFFSNLILDASVYGTYSLYAMIPSFLITTLGVAWSRKVGIKKAFVLTTWLSTLMLIGLIVFTPAVIGQGVSGAVIALLSLFAVQQGMGAIAGNIVIPMIADCSDYETYRTGRFIPGMMGTLFSFVDKLISSASTFIIGAAIAWAGFGNVKIEPNKATNSKFEMAILFVIFGLPLIGHIASIIAMKFYELTAERMHEIQHEIHLRKVGKAGKVEA